MHKKQTPSWNEAFLRTLPSKVTREGYASALTALNDFFAPFAGDEGEDQLVRFVRRLEIKGLSPASVKKRLHQLRRIVGYCHRAGLRDDNCVDLTWAPRIRDNRRPKCLQRAELRRVAEAIDVGTWRGVRDAAAFALMARTGLRIGEVAKINVEDLEIVR